MRLNFAGSPDDDIREGIRRIGRTMGGQAGLYGVLTSSSRGHRSGEPAAQDADAKEKETPAETPGPADAGLADVVELPRRGEQARARSAGEQQDR